MLQSGSVESTKIGASGFEATGIELFVVNVGGTMVIPNAINAVCTPLHPSAPITSPVVFACPVSPSDFFFAGIGNEQQEGFFNERGFTQQQLVRHISAFRQPQP